MESVSINGRFQQNKSKVRPVLSILELNGYAVAYTAHSDFCAKVKKV